MGSNPTLSAILKLHKIKNLKITDSFAVALLEKGVSIETVSMLLGHSDTRIILRHYRPWVKSLQDHLENEVQKAWVVQAIAS